MGECEWCRLYKTAIIVIQHICETFLYRRSVTDYQLLREIKIGHLFDYVQCDIEVAAGLRTSFANFPLIFKNFLVSQKYIGELIEDYAEGEAIMSQPLKRSMSSLLLQHATLITPLFLFNLEL